ncbi:MAG: hypothetical protein OXH57_11070 [Ekhidna sp.]|nr:hypothetical protein [Ekhidna sp.]
MTTIVDIFLIALAIYLILGVFYSIYFYAKGGIQIDKRVKGAPWHFKLIIFPGVVLFWSILVKKRMKKS